MSDTLPVLALSVRQPWAWAIFNGKDVENRDGHSTALKVKTKVPFRVAIHASKGMTQDEYEDAREFMLSLGVACPRPDDLVRGGIIGSVRVRAVVQNWSSPWFFGPYALVLQHPEPCVPLPGRGALGYFEWSKALVNDIDEPKPWMKAWPDSPARPPRQPKETPLPLFEDLSQ